MKDLENVLAHAHCVRVVVWTRKKGRKRCRCGCASTKPQPANFRWCCCPNVLYGYAGTIVGGFSCCHGLNTVSKVSGRSYLHLLAAVAFSGGLGLIPSTMQNNGNTTPTQLWASRVVTHPQRPPLYASRPLLHNSSSGHCCRQCLRMHVQSAPTADRPHNQLLNRTVPQ